LFVLSLRYWGSNSEGFLPKRSGDSPNSKELLVLSLWSNVIFINHRIVFSREIIHSYLSYEGFLEFVTSKVLTFYCYLKFLPSFLFMKFIDHLLAS